MGIDQSQSRSQQQNGWSFQCHNLICNRDDRERERRKKMVLSCFCGSKHLSIFDVILSLKLLALPPHYRHRRCTFRCPFPQPINSPLRTHKPAKYWVSVFFLLKSASKIITTNNYRPLPLAIFFFFVGSRSVFVINGHFIYRFLAFYLLYFATEHSLFFSTHSLTLLYRVAIVRLRLHRMWTVLMKYGSQWKWLSLRVTRSIDLNAVIT